MRRSWILLLALGLLACGERHDRVRITEETLVETFASADRAAIDRLIAAMRAAPSAGYEGLLVAGLAHDDRGVREWSAHALGDLGYSSDATISALIVAFGDEDDWVRWKAVRALGMIGPKAKRALPLIEPAANAVQEAEVVRAAAKVAVTRMRAGD